MKTKQSRVSTKLITRTDDEDPTVQTETPTVTVDAASLRISLKVSRDFRGFDATVLFLFLVHDNQTVEDDIVFPNSGTRHQHTMQQHPSPDISCVCCGCSLGCASLLQRTPYDVPVTERGGGMLNHEYWNHGLPLTRNPIWICDQ